MPVYKLTKYQGFQGHDSWCYSANIRRDGKLIGQVSDSGMGGEAMFDFAQGVSKEQQQQITQEVEVFVAQIARLEWQNDDETQGFWKTAEEYAQSCTRSIWDYFTHQLIDRMEDVKQVKGMKPRDDEVVWEIAGNGESVVVRGKTYLYLIPAHVTKEEVKAKAVKETKVFPYGVKSVRKLHTEKELVI